MSQKDSFIKKMNAKVVFMNVTLPWPPSSLNPNKRPQNWTEAEDAYLAETWKTKGHKAIGEAIGRTEKAVRNRCYRLGLVDGDAKWAPEDIAKLVERYKSATSNEQLNLAKLAAELGRLKSNVSRKARALGLTLQTRKGVDERQVRVAKYKTAEERAAATGARIKAYIAECGHPRGAAGIRHTAEAKAAISAASRRSNAARTADQLSAYALKSAKTKVANGTYAQPRQRTTWRGGWRAIGGTNSYYRSRWEANYARHLERLRLAGEIATWRHEPTVFYFEGVQDGAVSYLPDFEVIAMDGSTSFHEVKGWMDARSKTKIQRMAEHYPDVMLVLIDASAYEKLERKVGADTDGWERSK